MNKLFLSVLSAFILLSCNMKRNENKEQFMKDEIDTVFVERKKNKIEATFTIKVSANSDWKLFQSTSPDNISLSNSLLSDGKGDSTFTLKLKDSSKRYYFHLVTNDTSVIFSERHLPIEGGYNFRDLGGFRNKEGRNIKWGKVFRSDDLHNLKESDLAYLSSIPLVSIVDFRAEEEINLAPDRRPSTVKNEYKYSVSPGNLMSFVKSMHDINLLTEDKVDDLMVDLNLLLVNDLDVISKYRQFFELLQNEEKIPLIFHCSAGKDRTGMGAALFLYSLNVDEEIIFADYLASNIYLGDKYAAYVEKQPALKPLFEVKTKYLKSGIDQIKKEYGSVENYLRDVLKVDLEKMKRIYLY